MTKNWYYIYAEKRARTIPKKQKTKKNKKKNFKTDNKNYEKEDKKIQNICIIKNTNHQIRLRVFVMDISEQLHFCQKIYTNIMIQRSSTTTSFEKSIPVAIFGTCKI